MVFKPKKRGGKRAVANHPDGDHDGCDTEAGEAPAITEDADATVGKSVSGMLGSVIKARRYGLFLQFESSEAPGTMSVAALMPGKAYVNGRALLLDSCRTDREMELLFPDGMKLFFDADGQKAQMVPDDGDRLPAEAETEAASAAKRTTYAWRISMLWVGQRPDETDFVEVAAFEEHQKFFQQRLEEVEAQIRSSLKEETKAKAEALEGEKWFVRTVRLTVPSKGLPHPDSSIAKGKSGVVSQVHRPEGGLIDVEGVDQPVYFHRSRVFLDDMHLSVTLDLMQFIKVGSAVTVEYVENELPSGGGVYFENCPSKYVALLVYTGSRPEVPALIFHNHAKSFNEREKFCIAKIIRFDPPGETGVESGVAELLLPNRINNPAFVKNSFKRMIDAKPEAKLVRFHRKNMFHLGSLLHKADLQYFFSSQVYSMDTFYCYVKGIEGAKADKDEVTHEVTIGWKGSLSILHSTGQGGYSFTPNKVDDTLLYPRVFGFQNMRLLGQEGFDVETYENIIEGLLPPRAEYFGGNENVTAGTYIARLCDLFPPKHKNHVVSAGFVMLESGPHAGKKAFFTRAACSIFGYALGEADLQTILHQNDPVFVRLNSKEADSRHPVRLTVEELWMGWPTKDKPSQEAISRDQYCKFLLFLESHRLTLEAFKKAVSGKTTSKTFLPFRKDENKGTVVLLERSTANPKQKVDTCATGGVIRVDCGALAGKLVHFHRRNTWVMGHNLASADLTHIFVHGQKVSLEATDTHKDKQKKNDGIEYVATLVWTSKFRPRIDFQKTVPESLHVNNWLKKRGLTFNSFQDLVQGKLPPVNSGVATRHDNNMLRENEAKDKDKATAAAEAAANLGGDKPVTDNSNLPVFRHGQEAARICDEALSVAGPDDLRLGKIIKNDRNAQVAYDLCQALGLALEIYRKKKGPRQNPRAQNPWVGDGRRQAVAAAAPWSAALPTPVPASLTGPGGAWGEPQPQNGSWQQMVMQNTMSDGHAHHFYQQRLPVKREHQQQELYPQAKRTKKNYQGRKNPFNGSE